MITDYESYNYEKSSEYVTIPSEFTEESVIIEEKDQVEFDKIWMHSFSECKQKYEKIAKCFHEFVGVTSLLLTESISASDEEKKVDSETQEYVKLWAQQVNGCYKTFSRFMEHLSSKAPEIGHPGCSITYKDMTRAVQQITKTTFRALNLYHMVFKMIPFQDAIARIKAAHGNLTTFARILQRTCFTADWKSILGYAVSFLGPVGLAAGIAAAVGLLLTGWGALIIAGGVVVGFVAAKMYHSHRQSELEQNEAKLREELKNLKGFFHRWHKIDETLQDSDIFVAIDALQKSQECFDIVCTKMFPRIQEPLQLLEDCYVCQQNLVTDVQHLTDAKRGHINVPIGYTARTGDVIVSTQCEKKHMLHYHCYSDMIKNHLTQCGICRKEFNPAHIQILYRKLPPSPTQQSAPGTMKEMVTIRLDRKGTLKKQEPFENPFQEWRQ